MSELSTVSAPAILAPEVTPKGTEFVSYTSPKFSELNLTLRGNFRFFGVALSRGIAVDALPYANPNRNGRGGCFPYTSANFGSLSTYTVEGVTYVRIADKATREAILSKVDATEQEAILARIVTDYTECVEEGKRNLTRKQS